MRCPVFANQKAKDPFYLRFFPGWVAIAVLLAFVFAESRPVWADPKTGVPGEEVKKTPVLPPKVLPDPDGQARPEASDAGKTRPEETEGEEQPEETDSGETRTEEDVADRPTPETYKAIPPDWEDPDPASYPPFKGQKIKPYWLDIQAINTGARVRARLFRANGHMIPATLRKAQRVFKDHRSKRQRRVSKRLLAVLYEIQQHYGRPIQLVSGYRKKKRRRRRKGRKRGYGSRHWHGEAADIRVPGVPPEHLAHFIRGRFSKVGVGHYPVSKFVHVDVRKSSYYWIDFSGPGEGQRNRPVEVVRQPKWGSDWTAKTTRLPKKYRPAPKPRAKKKKARAKGRKGKKKTSKSKKRASKRKNKASQSKKKSPKSKGKAPKSKGKASKSKKKRKGRSKAPAKTGKKP